MMSRARPSADRPVLAQPCGAASLERRTGMPKVLRFGLWWAGTHTPTLGCSLVAKKLRHLATEPGRVAGTAATPAQAEPATLGPERGRRGRGWDLKGVGGGGARVSAAGRQ